MAIEKAPAFQFYPKEFLCDGNVAGMTNREVGAYIKLLCICWIDGSLPRESARLANMVGESKRDFDRMWPAIAPCFTVDGERLKQPRLDREREKQAEYRATQAEKGRRSGAARATGRQPQQQPDTNHGSTGVATEHTTERVTDAQPQPNSPISDLRSPTEIPSGSRRARATGTVFEGALPRDHMHHAACSPNCAWCVPSTVHGKFRTALLARFDGEVDQASSALQAWYAEVWRSLPADTVIGDAFRFWQPLFDAKWAAAAAPAARGLNLDAIAAEVARQNAEVGL